MPPRTTPGSRSRVSGNVSHGETRVNGLRHKGLRTERALDPRLVSDCSQGSLDTTVTQLSAGETHQIAVCMQRFLSGRSRKRGTTRNRAALCPVCEPRESITADYRGCPRRTVLDTSQGHLSGIRTSCVASMFYESFSYQAQSWNHPRRLVAKVEWHWDELFPRVGFIVTNMTGWSRKVVKFCNGRGTAEQWIKEGKYAVKWTRLSCRNFRDNQARLQLFALAYNLGNFLRRLALPRSVKHWSLTTLREKLIKIGAKVVTHSRHVIFQMGEVAVPRELFAAILNRIQRFGVPPPLVQRG